MHNCYKSTPCSTSWICRPIHALPQSYSAAPRWAFPQTRVCIPCNCHNAWLYLTPNKFLWSILKVTVDFSSFSLILITQLTSPQNYKLTDTNKKANVPLAIIIIYFLFTSTEENTTFFAFSRLPNTLKTALRTLSICVTLCSLPCIYTSIILFSVIN